MRLLALATLFASAAAQAPVRPGEPVAGLKPKGSLFGKSLPGGPATGKSLFGSGGAASAAKGTVGDAMALKLAMAKAHSKATQLLTKAGAQMQTKAGAQMADGVLKSAASKVPMMAKAVQQTGLFAKKTTAALAKIAQAKREERDAKFTTVRLPLPASRTPLHWCGRRRRRSSHAAGARQAPHGVA